VGANMRVTIDLLWRKPKAACKVTLNTCPIEPSALIPLLEV